MSESANQRTAIVTGAARGIGKAIARRLVDDGYRVGLTDADDNELAATARELGDGVELVVADLLDSSATAAAIDALAGRLGGSIDLLVSNAGLGIERPFFDLSLKEWDRVIAIDLTAPFVIARACWPYLAKPGGAIVTVSSVHGSRPLPGQAAYASAKGGLNNFTKVMALDAGPWGVRVNGVMPGFIETRLWDDWMAGLGPQAEPTARAVSSLIPVGRPGLPSEVADAVAWLGSPAAAYVNGVMVEVDGGLTARAFTLPQPEEDGGMAE